MIKVVVTYTTTKVIFIPKNVVNLSFTGVYNDYKRLYYPTQSHIYVDN